MRLLLAVPAAFFAVAFAWPVWNMLAAGTDVEAWRWIAGPFVSKRATMAVVQALLSTVLALALALPLAWLHQRRIAAGRIVLAIHAAPFVLPVFVIVLGVRTVAGPGGWLSGLGIDLIGSGGLVAVVVAHAYYNYGFAARILHGALQRRPRTLEDAAATLGAGPGQRAWRVTAALLAPTLGAVALLVFLFSLTSFGVVLYLGGGTIDTLETLMYSNLRGAFPRPERAAALALLQLAINALALTAYAILLRRQRSWSEAPKSVSGRRTHHVVAWTLVAVAVTPVLAVLTGGFRVRGGWTLAPWRALVDADAPGHVAGFDLGHALGLSLGYAAASAVLSLALTVSLAYGLRGMRSWARTVADAVAALPLGTSSLLIGFGFLITFGISGFVQTWSGRVLIVMAHALVAFPFVARTLLPALGHLEARLDDAAAILGASPAGVAWRIHRPLLRRTLTVAIGFAVAMSLGDFGASLLLQNADNRSLAVWIDLHGVASFDPLRRAQATALAGLLMVLTVGAYAAVESGERT